MPGFRLYSELSLSVRITDFIPYGTKVIHDRLAVSEDGFKNLFLVLMQAREGDFRPAAAVFLKPLSPARARVHPPPGRCANRLSFVCFVSF
jgi:hypothetical protein